MSSWRNILNWEDMQGPMGGHYSWPEDIDQIVEKLLTQKDDITQAIDNDFDRFCASCADLSNVTREYTCTSLEWVYITGDWGDGEQQSSEYRGTVCDSCHNVVGNIVPWYMLVHRLDLNNPRHAELATFLGGLDVF